MDPLGQASFIQYIILLCSVTEIYHDLFIHSPIDRYLGCFFSGCFEWSCHEHFCMSFYSTFINLKKETIYLFIYLFRQRDREK